MDQRTDAIRQEIEQTRASMTEKLELIEARVQGTVEDVKETMTVQGLVRKRPWTMFGAAVFVGLLLGWRGGAS